MISNQILQNTIDGLKGITRIDLCVLDMEGQTLASTEAQPENFGGEVAAFISSPADSQVVQERGFRKPFAHCFRTPERVRETCPYRFASPGSLTIHPEF